MSTLSSDIVPEEEIKYIKFTFDQQFVFNFRFTNHKIVKFCRRKKTFFDIFYVN